MCGDSRLQTGWTLTGGSNAAYDPFVDEIHVCAQYLDAVADVVDTYMTEAYKVYGWLYEGNVVGVGDEVHGFYENYSTYLQAATTLSKVALSAVSTLSRTLMHEMIHRYKWAGGHCTHKCCMQRIALTWQCRVSAYLGLYAADGNGIDWAGNRTPAAWPPGLIAYSSVCQDSIFSDPTKFMNSFDGNCQLTNPGEHGDKQDYAESGSQFNESGGRTGTCTDSAGNPDFCNPAACSTCG
jgi:hypothetical protein